MKAVIHKCPNCKAALKLNDEAASGICDYCRVPYTIDDGVIHVEHTIEIVDDTSLKVANTTLYKFKEYEESELLFRKLLFKCGHKPEVYIGLILSITHDFKKEIVSIPAMNEINELWERFVSIGKEKDISKYTKKINKLNCIFWLKELNEHTDNLKNYKTKASLKVLDFIYNNYITFCSNQEKDMIQSKYNKFRKEKVLYEKKRNNCIKFSIIFIIALIIIIFLANYIILINEKLTCNKNYINISELSKYCDLDGNCNSDEFILNTFDKTRSQKVTSNLKVDKDNMKVTVSVHLKNRYKEISNTYEYKLIDDVGTLIYSNNCRYTDTQSVDVFNCFKLYDYTDGYVDSRKATVELNDADFTKVGNHMISVNYTDSDGNVTREDINIEIIMSNIKLNLDIKKKFIEVNKTNVLTQTITPDVLNKNVKYEYDKDYILFNEDTKVIKGLQIGKSNLCVIPLYDESKKECIEIRVINPCKNTYTFKFDGSTTSKIFAGNDFCPGKYKVYVGVLNKKNSVHLSQYDSDGKHLENILIWKSASSLSDEGNIYSFGLDGSLSVPSGVTSVKLVRQ